MYSTKRASSNSFDMNVETLNLRVASMTKQRANGGNSAGYSSNEGTPTNYTYHNSPFHAPKINTVVPEKPKAGVFVA